MLYEPQLDAFRKLHNEPKGTPNNGHISNNFRPTKPLNGRTIYKSFK